MEKISKIVLELFQISLYDFHAINKQKFVSFVWVKGIQNASKTMEFMKINIIVIYRILAHYTHHNFWTFKTIFQHKSQFLNLITIFENTPILEYSLQFWNIHNNFGTYIPILNIHHNFGTCIPILEHIYNNFGTYITILEQTFLYWNVYHNFETYITILEQTSIYCNVNHNNSDANCLPISLQSSLFLMSRKHCRIPESYGVYI